MFDRNNVHTATNGLTLLCSFFSRSPCAFCLWCLLPLRSSAERKPSGGRAPLEDLPPTKTPNSAPAWQTIRRTIQLPRHCVVSSVNSQLQRTEKSSGGLAWQKEWPWTLRSFYLRSASTQHYPRSKRAHKNIFWPFRAATTSSTSISSGTTFHNEADIICTACSWRRREPHLLERFAPWP